MLLRICTNNRKRFLLVVKSREEFQNKVKQVLNLDCNFRCVLEEDGSEILDDCLDAIIDSNEKVGTVMILKGVEEWAKDSTTPIPMASIPALPTLEPSSSSSSLTMTMTTSGSTTKRSFHDVRAILGNNPKGSNVLAEYDRHGTLSSESRQTLVKILVAELVQECGYYPSADRKLQLGGAITTALPGLKDPDGTTGYDHFFNISNGQSGYIQDRLKRVRRSLTSEKQQRPRKKICTNALQPLQHNADEVICNLPCGDESVPVAELGDAELEQLRLDCLYANPVTDRATILSSMAKTAPTRQHWIRTDTPSITEVIEKYPRLEDVPLDLLDIDFRVHFPDAMNCFITNFPKWTEGVIVAARLSRKRDIVEMVREYDAQQHSAEFIARDHMYAVLLLLHLLPSSNTKQKAKLSSVELESQFVSFKPEHTSIEEFLSQKKSQSKQPFLLCLGCKDNPSVFFLILDSKAVRLGECGILRAVDALFKSHFVYWVNYAKPLVLLWEFIQKLVYEIECTTVSKRILELKSSISAAKAKNTVVTE